MEVELTKYACGGDIPWHRVLYFRHGDFLWHKETRLDLVFHSTDLAAANLPGKAAIRLADRREAEQNRADAEEAARLKAWVPRRSKKQTTIFQGLEKVHIHSVSRLTGEWVALDQCASGTLDVNPNSSGNELSVSTLNVLSDFHLPEHLKRFSQQRWNRVAEIIANNPSHIWVLTEVVQSFASLLLSCDAIKEIYRSSIGASNNFRGIPADPSATGQLVLIRRDIACNSVYFTKAAQSTGKVLTLVTCSLPSGATVGLCAVHLTSGQKDSSTSSLAVEKRTSQLAEALKHLHALQVKEEPCLLQVIAGDFNFKSAVDDHANASLLNGFVEAGVHLQRNTYVPSQNRLARLNGSGDNMRLDRIYMKFSDTGVRSSVSPKVVDHRLLATEPLEALVEDKLGAESDNAMMPLMTSDHFGVSTTFSVTSDYTLGANAQERGNSWTATTALALLPTKEYQQFLDEWIRSEHDSSVKKWPAHCNVLFPFVAPKLIAATLSDLSDSIVVHGFKNEILDISFSGVNSFRHKATSNIHLEIAAPTGNKLRELHNLAKQSAERIAGAMPSRKHAVDIDYNPHVTLAKIRRGPGLDGTGFIERVQREFEEFDSQRWKCVPHTLVVLQKCDDRMNVVAEQTLPPALNQASLTKQTLLLLRSICKLVFKGSSNFEIHPVGSAALLKGKGEISDVDVVLSAPEMFKSMTSKEFADAVTAVMAATGNHRVRGCTGDATIISIDLQDSHALLPIDIMFGETKYSLQAQDDFEQLSQVLEGLIADQKLTRDVFTDALSQIKIWARSRMLTQRAYGLWSGIAWSIMLLAVCRTGGYTSTQELISSFFAFYVAVDWEIEAVSIDGLVSRNNLTVLDGRDCRKDGAIVLSAGKWTDRSNVIRGVSRTVALDMKRELALAQTHHGRGDDASWIHFMSTPAPSMRDVYDSCIVVRFSFTKTDNMMIDVANIEGWLKGRFALFSTAELGERGLCVRPSAKLDVEAHGVVLTAELVCGIDEDLSSPIFSKRAQLVRHAELQIRDRFLRWDDRPPSAVVEVKLETSLE